MTVNVCACVQYVCVYLYDSLVCMLQLIPNYESFIPSLVNLEEKFLTLVS